jgi:glutamyl-tRNA synthetase
MSAPAVVRFAPSPTGPPHVGNLRTALFNWLLARATGGRFILRIEDTDRERYNPEAEEAMLAALRWLGMDWDEGPDVGGPHAPYRQSERKALYQEAADHLLADGHAYRCTCTPERLEKVQARLRTRVYDGHCRDKAIGQTDEPHVIRLRTSKAGSTTFTDALRGQITFENKRLPGDVVLIKSDGYPTYHMGVVVDDHAMGVTHVMRADEWIASTPLHVMLYAALGWEPPQFVHLPLVTDPSGPKLSKREGGVAIEADAYRREGYLPEAMMNYLALLGWHPGGMQEVMSRDELIALFSIERLSKSPSAFDVDRLRRFSQQHVATLPRDDLAARCIPLLMDAYPDAAARDAGWLAALVDVVRDEITVLNDVAPAARWAFQAPTSWEGETREALASPPAIPVLERLHAALSDLSDDPTQEVVQAILSDLRAHFKAENGWNGRAVMFPLRAALTGSLAGPHLADVVALLGREACLSRIGGALAFCM